MTKTSAWPAIMKTKTLRAYLDAQDYRSWQAMKVILSNGGYSNIDDRFHRKDLIDAALGIGKTIDPKKSALLEKSK